MAVINKSELIKKRHDLLRFLDKSGQHDDIEKKKELKEINKQIEFLTRKYLVKENENIKEKIKPKEITMKELIKKVKIKHKKLIEEYRNLTKEININRDLKRKSTEIKKRLKTLKKGIKTEDDIKWLEEIKEEYK